jgi:hypothetical protein
MSNTFSPPLFFFPTKIIYYSLQNTKFIARLYKGKFKNAVMTAFPEIGLVAEQFDIKDRKFSFPTLIILF